MSLFPVFGVCASVGLIGLLALKINWRETSKLPLCQALGAEHSLSGRNDGRGTLKWLGNELDSPKCD